MALNVNRNLPSFSEMLGAMQNRNSLGEEIKAGISGYFSGAESARRGRETAADIDLKKAQAEKARAEATADPMKDYVDIRGLAGSLSREQYNTLAATAMPMGDKLMVKRTEVQGLIPLVKEQGAERRAELEREKERQLQLERERAADERQASGQVQSATETIARMPEPKVSFTEKLAAKAATIPVIGPIVKPFAETAIRKQEKAGDIQTAQKVLKGQFAAPKPIKKGKPGSKESPVPVYTEDDYNALPMGAWFVDDSGKPTQKGAI